MNPFPLQNGREELKKTLFQNAMKSNWDEVIKTYEEDEDSHTAKITSSGDTALHIAISNGEESVVEVLVPLLREGALKTQNDHGDTPLHVAAYLGNAEMCRCIAAGNSKLMGIRNADNEKPFFLTVRYGWKEAFQAMHEICKDREGYRYCRGKDGETILHSAIDGEHFGIFVGEPTHKSLHNEGGDLHQYKEGANYPENHHTCITTFNLLRDRRDVMRALLGYSRRKYDVENTEEKSEDEKHANGNRLVNKLTTIFCGSRMANAERRQFERVKRSSKHNGQEHEFVTKNYIKFLTFLKFLTNTIMLLIFGLGSRSVTKIKEKKAQHIWSLQIMEKLLDHASFYEYEASGKIPRTGAKYIETPIPNIASTTDIDDGVVEEVPEATTTSERRSTSALDMDERQTPLLVAAKSGVVEMVAGILHQYPVAIHDTDVEKKNVVLLAVEHRQAQVYKFLLGEHQPWLIPCAALQMQWEIKWYEFVKNSMPPDSFSRYNNESKTSMDIFSETHGALVKEGGAWLTSTSQSCFVVAGLIATVAFPASATVPGGVKSDNSGIPTLQNKVAFSIFAMSSLTALCFSVTSVVMFLAILTSSFQAKDFGTELPKQLVVGMTSLFISIGLMLLSFCSGHFFMLDEKLQYTAFPMYVITSLPVIFFAINQFPLYSDLVWATISKVPQKRSLPTVL